MGANSALEAKTDIAASKYYRKHYCEASGLDAIRCDDVLDWAHIVSRRNRRLRYEPYNHLTLCRNHHRYWTDRPYEWERFVRNHFPERWREVKAHENEYQKVWAGFYEDWLEKFKGQSMRSNL